MKIKKEYLILGVVIVALVIYLAVRDSERTHYQLPELEKITASEITRIKIASKDLAIELAKKSDNWEILPEGYPANEGKIKQMLETIGNLKMTALVSESGNYIRYDLTDDKKIAVTAMAGDAIKRQFELGKAAPSYKHTFVKIAGDTRVYHARGSFRHQFDEEIDSLRDKKIMDFEIKDIKEILITKNGKEKHFRRTERPVEPSKNEQPKSDPAKKETVRETEPVWTDSNNQNIEPAVVNRLLTTLDEMDCDEYIYDRKKEDFKDPVYTLVLKGTQEIRLAIFARKEKGKGNYPCISSQNAYPFELTEYRAEDIIKSFDKKEEDKKETTDKS